MFILVFPQDFVDLQNIDICKENGTEMLEYHDMAQYSLDHTIARYMTKKDCKLYCASSKSCCGCERICTVSCEWYTLNNCERRKNSTQTCQQKASEKPGKPIHWKSYIFQLAIL